MKNSQAHAEMGTCISHWGRRLSLMMAGGVCACLMAVAALPGAAQENDEGKVAVGGSLVLTIRTPAGGMSIKERADAITERLSTFLAYENLKTTDVTVQRMSGNTAKILVRDKLFVTVVPEMSRPNNTTSYALAQIWAKNIRRVLMEHNVTPGQDVPVTPGNQGDVPR